MKKIVLLLAGVLLLAAGCAGPRAKGEDTRRVIEGTTQGGAYRVVYHAPDTVVSQRAVDSLLRELEASLSLYDPGSVLCRINRGETDTMDRHVRRCVETALRISEESGGLYDITVGPLIEAYGFGAGEARPRPNVDSLMQFVGYGKLRIEGDRLVRENPGVRIDLNSIAQGYTADVLADYLRGRGATDFLIDVGSGEIYASGDNAGRPWRIGIDRPADGNFSPGADLQAILTLKDKGLATSGNYRKFYIGEDGKRVHHTVDPLTGECVRHDLLSATVMAPNAMLADAYGTLFMVMGREKSLAFLANRPELGAYLVYAGPDGTFEACATDNLKANIAEE